MKDTNFLIIGSGVAGLTFAIKIAERFPHKESIIVTKASKDESNTKYAQGGVAAVLDSEEDSFQKHIRDTLSAGGGLCDEEVVKMVIKEGPEHLKELMRWGANFDTDNDGKLDLAKEGGHSEYRVIHYKDITGYEIERALLRKVNELPNITILQYHFAIDLITGCPSESMDAENKYCCGADVLNERTGNIFTIQADHTILASGGIGVVYGHTTNPVIATGDGIAMAYRVKAQIKDMEFVQFHPTALYDDKESVSFLISEAVRGFGAYLRTKNGHRFMPDYSEMAELAPRDVVSQSIVNELKKHGDSCVYLDCTHLNKAKFLAHFPNIYKACINNNIDITKDWIPVVPAAHYVCGGIAVDKNGKTSIENLFSCGESSGTGLHGANRLASNSLLEALVYAHNIYEYLCEHDPKMPEIEVSGWFNETTRAPIDLDLIRQDLNELQELMRDNAGIIRTNTDLLKALRHLTTMKKRVEELYNKAEISTPLCELRNMIAVAYLIIEQSLERKENRGVFFNYDNILTTSQN